MEGGGGVYVLGIESTAHTFGASVVSDSPPYILSDARRVYRPKRGGILPREVAAFFSSVAGDVIREALRDAGVSIEEIAAVAVALGPGMGPALRVGATVARALAAAYGKPLVPVNHAVAHIEISRFTTGLLDPVVIYVSGGNTLVSTFMDGRYRVFGETLDIALGNLLDTFAREAGIAPPYVVEGKHAVDRCAEGGDYVDGLIPYAVKGQDVSYSGLLTAALRALKRLGRSRLADICYTLREVAFSMIIEVAERCIFHTGKREVILAGGVAANDLLREKTSIMARERGVRFAVLPKKYAVDNGVMIALTGLLHYIHGHVVDPSRAFIRQRWRLDEVEVPWYPSTLGRL